MGQIRNYQTEALRQGSEPITFERYDYNGDFIETINEDILYQCPKDLTPINKDLVKNYERPLKKVEFITDLTGNYFINENAHFLYDNYRYILGSTSPEGKITGTGTTQEFISDANKQAKALSGGKYFRSNIAVDGADRLQGMLSNEREFTIVGTRQDLLVEFDYHIRTTSTNDTWELPIRAFVQETYSASPSIDAYYDFDNNEWKTTDSDDYKSANETSAVNVWNKNSNAIKGYIPTSDSVTQVYLTITIGYPNNLAGSPSLFQEVFIDNFRISESYDVENTIVSRRQQYDYTGRTYTGEYKSEKNILSNEAQTTEYFIGKINGYFRRNRDTSDKTLEQIITQEIINDNRNYMTKYEGTFRGGRDGHLSLHNKVWIDFGTDLLQEPVSCYLDAMKYDIKNSQYQIRMHVPNQDDDVDSTYNVIIE